MKLPIKKKYFDLKFIRSDSDDIYFHILNNKDIIGELYIYNTKQANQFIQSDNIVLKQDVPFLKKTIRKIYLGD